MFKQLASVHVMWIHRPSQILTVPTRCPCFRQHFKSHVSSILTLKKSIRYRYWMVKYLFWMLLGSGIMEEIGPLKIDHTVHCTVVWGCIRWNWQAAARSPIKGLSGPRGLGKPGHSTEVVYCGVLWCSVATLFNGLHPRRRYTLGGLLNPWVSLARN